MSRQSQYGYLRLCKDEELRSLEQRLREAARETWLHAGLVMFTVLVGPALVLGVIYRAAERSSTSDVVTWAVLSALVLLGLWRHRLHWERRRHLDALLDELVRRGL